MEGARTLGLIPGSGWSYYLGGLTIWVVLLPGWSYYLGGLAQVTCVFVPLFSHSFNEDITPTALWEMKSYQSHTQHNTGHSFGFLHSFSSLLGTTLSLALVGIRAPAPAPWIMANPTQEPKRGTKSLRKHGPPGGGGGGAGAEG